MDDIIQRLKDASETCVKTYEAWDKAKTDVALRETLQESLHELRKSTARLEIEIAVSERKEAPQKSLPIPPHRAAQRPQGDKLERPKKTRGKPAPSSSDVNDDDDDNAGNSLPSFISGGDDNASNNNGGGKSRGGARRGGQRRGKAASNGGDE